MSNLSLDLFVSGARDVERAQYEILGGIQHVRKAFAQNAIYPHLSELVHLYQSLRTIVERSDDLKSAKPGSIKEIDLEGQRVIYDDQTLSDQHMAGVEQLIHWALPHIQSAIEEGTTIFEFVEEHLQMEEVGVVPSYVKEGYLIVPDLQDRASHVLRYEMSIFTGADERFRTLRTTHVKTIEHETIGPSPHSVKLDLLAQHPDLPNPATFCFRSAIDFPFEQTTLPVAKRKLMRHLYGQIGSA